MTAQQILDKLRGRRFHAPLLEKILQCHVSTVELHSLVERGELKCDKLCALTVGWAVQPALKTAHEEDDDGYPKTMTPELWSAHVAAERKAAGQPVPAGVLRDRKGAPLTVDRAPCTFEVADEALLLVWLTAKIEQRERHRAPAG